MSERPTLEEWHIHYADELQTRDFRIAELEQKVKAWELHSDLLGQQLAQEREKNNKFNNFARICLDGWEGDIREWIDDGEPEDQEDRKFSQEFIDTFNKPIQPPEVREWKL